MQCYEGTSGEEEFVMSQFDLRHCDECGFISYPGRVISKHGAEARYWKLPNFFLANAKYI
jgi:hypothetical protein